LLRIGFPVGISLPLQLGILFVLCLNCHGRLAESKPSGEGLTVFYLAIASGGFAGSLLVGMILPCINTFFIEYPGSFFLAVCAIAVAAQDEKARIFSKDGFAAAGCSLIVILALTVVPWTANHFFRLSEKEIFVILSFFVFIVLRIASKRMQSMAVVLFAVMLCSQWVEQVSSGAEKAIRMRNYYGVYLVYDANAQRYLKHGTTLHGRQYLSGEKTKIPLSYYHPTAPAGQLLSADPFQFRSIGMIGLGAGAISAYVGPSQKFTVYELDPDNLLVAERYFSYLRRAREKGACINFVFGDGRISLRNEAAGSLDLLIIDAFNSGSIPIHLMTTEAIEEYFRVLKPDGLLLMHISNRIFDFWPVLSSAAQRIGLYACTKTNGEYVNPDADFTVWAAFCRDKRTYERLLNEYKWVSFQADGKKRVPPWTDQYSNLFNALR
jgi:SAM-dependent methyltransferase